MSTILFKPSEAYAMKCLVVDDESIAIKGIVNNISKFAFLEIKSTCSSAIEAIDILKKEEIDLMFLDINMPYLSGLEFLESLEKPPLTIITTAYSEYALEGFRLNVVDYLMKPIAFQRFSQAVSKARDIFSSQLVRNGQGNDNSNMYVRQGDKFQRINWKDILYAESMQNYVKLYFEDRIITIHQTMVSLEEILPKHSFFRAHRSYLVNTAHIESILGNRLVINSKELPISKQRKDELLAKLVYKNLISK